MCGIDLLEEWPESLIQMGLLLQKKVFPSCWLRAQWRFIALRCMEFPSASRCHPSQYSSSGSTRPPQCYFEQNFVQVHICKLFSAPTGKSVHNSALLQVDCSSSTILNWKFILLCKFQSLIVSSTAIFLQRLLLIEFQSKDERPHLTLL